MNKNKIEAILEDIAKNVFDCKYTIEWHPSFLNSAFIDVAKKSIEKKRINVALLDDMCPLSEIASITFKKKGYEDVVTELYISYVLKNDVIYVTNTHSYNDCWEPYVFHSENGLDYAINLVDLIYEPAQEYPHLLDINNDDLIAELEEKIFKPFNERNNTKLMYWCGMFASDTETEIVNYKKD